MTEKLLANMEVFFTVSGLHLSVICFVFIFHYRICYLGERLLTSSSVTVDGVMMCIKNETGPIFQKYCTVGPNETTCDTYFKEHDTYTKPGIPGLASGVFSGNHIND